MVGVGINLFGLSTGSNTKRSITQSPGSTRSLGLSLTDPTDIDHGWRAKSICSQADPHCHKRSRISIYIDQFFITISSLPWMMI